MIKKILSLLFASTLLFNFLSNTVKAYSAVSYCLFDPVMKKVIASSDMHRKMPMASTTKIMTAIIVCEVCNLDEVITVSDKMIAVEGSSIGLQVGDKISYRCLLYGLMLESGNDAALCIAISISGSQKDFATLMNEKARQIGMKDSNFVTPNGLDDEHHYSTAYDMALLSGYAMNNELFAKIVATKVYKAEYNGGETVRTYYNHNRLLSSLEGAEGIKTGFTKKSGRCLVSSCKRDGVRLIAVTLNDGNDWRDHKNLYDYGFKQYQKATLPVVNKYISVVGGKRAEIKVESVPTEVLFYEGNSSDISYSIYLPKFLYAPIKKGARVGSVVYTYNGSTVATADIIAIDKTEKINNQSNQKTSYFEKLMKTITILLSFK